MFDEGFRTRYAMPGVRPDQPVPDWVARDDTLRGLAGGVGIDAAGLEAAVAEIEDAHAGLHERRAELGGGRIGQREEHDVGVARKPLDAGMAFTIEPGIYIREAALNDLPKTPENAALIEKVRPMVAKYKDIGVRIEDDLLITADGVKWMTEALPRKLSEIEDFIAKARRQSE